MNNSSNKIEVTNFIATENQPLLTIQILDIQYQQPVNANPVVCYVYLGDKIQDVRGVSKDESRVKLASFSNLYDDTQTITIQVKQTPVGVIGFLKVEVSDIINQQNSMIKSWFPLSTTKDKTLSIQSLQNTTVQQPRIYIDFKITEGAGSPPRGRLSNQTSKERLSLNTQDKFYDANDHFSMSPISNPSTQQEQSQKGSLSKMAESYISRRSDHSPGQMSNNTQSEIYIKKKKNLTQSANPTLSMMKSPERVKQQTIIVEGMKGVDEELLNTRSSSIEPNVVKKAFNDRIDTGISHLHEQSDKGFHDIMNTLKQVKEISNSDSQDIHQYKEREQLLSKLQKDIQLLSQKRQENLQTKQNLQTQLNHIDQDNKQNQKRDALHKLKEQNEKLKDDLHQSSNDSQVISPKSNQQLSNQILAAKQELLALLQQLKVDLSKKSLINKVYEEADSCYNDSLLVKQTEANSQIEELVNEKFDKSILIQQLEQELNVLLNQTKDRELDLDKRKIQIQIIQKHIQNIINEGKQSEKAYNDIIAKIKLRNKNSLVQNDQLKSKIQELEKEKKQVQEALTIQKQQLNENEYERSRDGKVQSNQNVQNQYNKVQEELQGLLIVMQTRLETIQDIKDIWHTLQIELTDQEIVSLLDVTGMEKKVSEKNQQLIQKVDLVNEIIANIDGLNTSIDISLSKQDINKVFKEGLANLIQKERDLKVEYERIKKSFNDINKIQEEIDEKLKIQHEDFEAFYKERTIQDKEIREQEAVETERNKELIKIKTQNELENELRDKVAYIREMEATLRGKDHEIDTLELIQAQKDSMILDLEEQAGRFKEVVKEVHYESQKYDRVEEALFRYLQVHPVRVNIKKLGDGYYKFGTRRIYLKLDNDDETLMVRIAPKEYITLNMFIIENEGVELQKLNIGKALLMKFK